MRHDELGLGEVACNPRDDGRVAVADVRAGPPAEHQQHDLHRGYPYVYAPESHRCVPYRRRQLGLSGPHALGSDKGVALHAEDREDSDEEDDDTHAAEPVRQATPEYDGLLYYLDIRHGRGAGRGEA